MARPSEPIFLERQSYRRRRLADGARLVPLLGLVLLLLPSLWAAGNRTSGGMIYVFTAWGVLIVIVWLLARPLSSLVQDRDQPEEPGEPEP